MYLWTRYKKISWLGAANDLPEAHLILEKNNHISECAWIAMQVKMTNGRKIDMELYSYKEQIFFIRSR
jgi:hypothetical protein